MKLILREFCPTCNKVTDWDGRKCKNHKAIPLKQRVAARLKEQQAAAPEMRTMENSAVITDIPSMRETSRQSNRLQRTGEGINLMQLALILVLIACFSTWLAYNYHPFGQTPTGIWLIEQSKVIMANFATPAAVAATEAAPGVAGCKPKSESDQARVDSFIVKFNGNVPSFDGLKLGTKEYLLVCFPAGPMIEFVSDSGKANAVAVLIDSNRTAEILVIVTGPTLAKGYWLIPVTVASNATQAPVISQPQVLADKVVVQVQQPSPQPTATRTQVPVVMDVVIPTAKPTFGGHIVPATLAPTKIPTAVLHIYPTLPQATALATTMSKVLTMAAPQATQAPTKAPTYAKTTMSRLLTLAAPTKAVR